MPTNYLLPNQGQYTFTDYIGINSADPQHATRHLFPSILLNGGFQEMPETVDMYEIPVETTGNGFGTPKITMDGFGSGRRRVGMLVHVLAEKKIYKLIPQGYYGNGGEYGLTEWNALTDTEKYEKLSPTATYNASYTPPNNYTESTPTGAAGDCWVELSLGIDGNPITDVTYSSGDLTITLTHDGSGSGTPIEFTTTLPTGYDGIYDPIVDDATVMPTDVGGIDGGTTAGDLSGLSMNQMWDKLLFPVVYPTGGGAGTLLNDTLGLVEAQEVLPSFTLTSTANMGTLSNPAGPWTGDVTGALVEELNGTGSGPFNPTVTPPNTINGLTFSYTAALGLNKWKLTTSFADGPMPVDSTGTDYPGVRYLAGVKTNTTDFEGVWPIYLGKADGTFEKRGLVGQSANDITCLQNYAEGPGIDHTILIPVDMIQGGDITIELYHPTLGNSPSYPTGAGGSSSVWTQTVVTMDVHANATGIQYYQYRKGGSTTGANTWIINW